MLHEDPFLLRVAAVCSSATISESVAFYGQVDEAFCEDETTAGIDIEDIVRFQVTMGKFESQTGAILSRL